MNYNDKVRINSILLTSWYSNVNDYLMAKVLVEVRENWSIVTYGIRQFVDRTDFFFKG